VKGCKEISRIGAKHLSFIGRIDGFKCGVCALFDWSTVFEGDF
jgi:hypothetical protein